MVLFYIIISIIILQRLIELKIAGNNEKWLREHGAVEFGKKHYKLLVLMHTLFFCSMIVEYNLYGEHTEFHIFNYLFLIFFVVLQVSRIWVLRSLGKYWNTKILRIPNSKLITSGPYKYFKHPNYIIVVCELFTIPLIFNLYYTAIIFSILNALVLSIRIRIENKALAGFENSA